MNDLDSLLQQVLTQAGAIGIPVSARICPQVHINSRATGRFGRCIRTGSGFTVELSDRFLEAPTLSCLQTLAHEVLHTCPGCANHGARWKEYAARMNEAYGYRIARTDTCQALGVDNTAKINYLLVCRRCGTRITRARRSKLVQHPERYRCRCGGQLVLCPPNATPPHNR